MNEYKYHQKLENCKTQAEKEKLNNKYLKSKVRTRKIKKLFKYLLENLIGILALIVAIIALFK